jgi:membrane protease YdiL (CAAX protease family)
MAHSAHITVPGTIWVPDYDPAAGPISRYLEKTKSYSLLRLIVELTCITFVLKIFVAILLAPFAEGMGAQKLLAAHKSITPALLIAALIAAPLLETLVLQWLPIRITSRFTTRPAMIVSISALFFAAAHVNLFHAAVILPLGFILAWVFLIKRKESVWKAFWVTTSLHAFHNSIALLWGQIAF